MISPGVVASQQSGLQPAMLQGVSLGNLSTSFPEPSGLARPTVVSNRGYIWMEQDSGGPNTFLAVNLTTLATAGSWTLQGVSQTDFEDCASAKIGGQSYLYMADIGDNGSVRSTVIIYRCKEPTITGSDGTIVSGDIETITCQFPGGNLPPQKDCEGFLVDPDTGDMYLITKRNFPALIYKLPHAASYVGTQTLTFMGKLATDTSATSLAIGTGSKVFTTVSGLAFQVGMPLRVVSRANTANFMEGQVTAISGNTLTIFIEVAGSFPTTGGSGTFTDWDISLASSYTPTGNNGCVTAGAIAPNGTEIALSNYERAYLWPRNKNNTIFATLQAAPKLMVGDIIGGNFYSFNVPSWPQRESIEYLDSGVSIVAISEFIVGGAFGTINPLIKFVRAGKTPTTVRLQQGLNSYASMVDTMITSATPGTDNSAAVSIIADIDFAVATTFSAVATASSGTMIDCTCPSSSTFVVGLGALITGSSVAGYNGTWEVDSKPSGTVVRLKCPFSATATGAIQAHTQDRQSLLKWTDLSAIPAGATIIDAKVQFYINTEGQSLQFNRMISAWAANSTYTGLGGIFTSNGVKAAAAKDVRSPGPAMDTYVGFYTMNVPVATVQGWLDGTLTNSGWTIQEDDLDVSGDGFQLDSSKSTTQTRRPMLIVSYTT